MIHNSKAITKNNYITWLSILFAIFSYFYLLAIKTALPFNFNISPIYIWIIIGTITYTLYLLLERKGEIPSYKLFIFPFIIFLYFCIQQMFLSGKLNVFFNNIIALLYFIITIDYFRNLPVKNLKKVSNIFITFAMLLLFTEAVFRIAPQFNFLKYGLYYLIRLQGTEILYMLKKNSIMFADSNSVGFMAGTMFFFVFYLSERFKNRYLVQKIVFFILTMFTFSRAAIISLVAIFLIYIIFKKKSKYNFVKLFLIIFIIIILIPYIKSVFSTLSTDRSLYMKLNIIDSTFEYLGNANFIQLLFGVGFGNAENYIGGWAHLFLITYFVETGVLGLLMMLFLFSLILIETKLKAFYLIAFLLITGLSFTPYAIAYFFVEVSLIFHLERKFFLA